MFAVCRCQVSKVLSTMCCLFVLVLYVHYCRVVCSTNLYSLVLFFYFQIHVSFVVFLCDWSIRSSSSGTSCGIRSPTVFTFARALLTFAACLTKFIMSRDQTRYTPVRVTKFGTYDRPAGRGRPPRLTCVWLTRVVSLTRLHRKL